MRGQQLTTEQALRRLRILGFTADDAPIARTLDLMRATLRGTFALPDRREVTHDWGLFTQLMMSSWLRLFIPDDPDACRFADRWANVLRGACAGGAYDGKAYKAAYLEEFGLKPRGARFEDFISFYTVALLSNRLDAETERRMFDKILEGPQGIYYIYEQNLLLPPAVFASLKTCRYIAALELLALYESAQCRQRMRPFAMWLRQNEEGGEWDLGPKANDGVYFPLSDDWRKAETRRADCTERITALLEQLER